MSATYNITMYNESDSQVKAKLTLDDGSVAAAAAVSQSASSASSDTVTLSVYPITGEITFLNINSPAAKLTGAMYVSLLGPTLTVLMTGNIPSLSMQYNLIDSAGAKIGGTFSFLGGDGGVLESWCFLGAQA